MEKAREMKTESHDYDATMANRRHDSISVFVEPLWADPFTLDGFKLSDTISHVVDAIVKKAKEINMLCRHPEGFRLQLPWRTFKFKRDTSLASVLESADDDDIVIGPSNTTITLVVFPPVFDLDGEVAEFPDEGENSDLEFSSSDEDADIEVDDEDDLAIYYKGKRGKTPTFSVRPNLGIDGDLELLDENDQPLPVAKLWDAEYLLTTASAILLAPNDRILNHLYALNHKHNKEYVILRVDRDLLSYVFLRVIRDCYPELPIVAVTDLDPDNLDILAFLDSSPIVVRRLYDLDLFHDECSSASIISHIDCVNIKWLGLRLSHRGNLLPEAAFDALARPPPSDFDMFMHRILRNPDVRCRKKWFQEFRLLKKYHKCVDFPSFGYDFIASRLSNNEWI